MVSANPIASDSTLASPRSGHELAVFGSVLAAPALTPPVRGRCHCCRGRRRRRRRRRGAAAARCRGRAAAAGASAAAAWQSRGSPALPSRS